MISKETARAILDIFEPIESEARAYREQLTDINASYPNGVWWNGVKGKYSRNSPTALRIMKEKYEEIRQAITGLNVRILIYEKVIAEISEYAMENGYNEETISDNPNETPITN